MINRNFVGTAGDVPNANVVQRAVERLADRIATIDRILLLTDHQRPACFQWVTNTEAGGLVDQFAINVDEHVTIRCIPTDGQLVPLSITQRVIVEA
ncbi:hypothetical protein Pla100_60570 [Neorhodopirellula pilleata]|uniref:Uncharacterized protein n=1 Tax=Neorhodopirellula pilleata TaxID=2714738 RepID=A0A5C5ZGH1_9BACT|nr:hypothetical protein Pla100_60570 [Neorhodopirellula pilleata]